MSLTVLRRLAATASLAAVGVVASGGTALAAPTGDYAAFTQCPTDNPAATTCLYSETTSGSFKIGNGTVPIDKTIVLQGAFGLDSETGASTFYGAKNGETLSRTPLTVPGGLLGLMDTEDFGNPLLRAFHDQVDKGNGVTATAELVGPVDFNFSNFLTGAGTAVGLPVRIKLDNPFLGPNCYIGSSSDPVQLQLGTGTTAPPPPNQPITGSSGDVLFFEDGDRITAADVSLVDNAFSVPAARGCSYFPLNAIVDPAVNFKQGLPAAAGVNSARLNGRTQLGSAARVAAPE